MITAGVDAGSRTIKVLLWDAEQGVVMGRGIADQGIEQDALALRLFTSVLEECALERSSVSRIIATGYGRNIVSFADETVTEITCHACGVRRLTPDARSIIEIGGQDSKFIRLDEHGLVRDFAMNDRCAAGTGRFLEMVAQRLNVPLEDLGRMAQRSLGPAPISSMCVVFAETEIIGLLATGKLPEDIVAGVQVSIARRVASMVGRMVHVPVSFTGGVALIPGMAHALEAAIGQPVSVAHDPQMTGALGAAIIAARR